MRKNLSYCLMRSLWICAVLLPFLSTGMSVFGQYPPRDDIDPFARTILAKELVYEFPLGASTDKELWIPLSNTALNVENATLRVQATGDDPYFASRALSEISGQGSELLKGTLEVSFRIKADAPLEGCLYWSEECEPGFSEQRHADFFYLGRQWQEVTIRIEAKTTLERLRFDPGPGRGNIDFEHIVIRRMIYPPFKLKPARWEGKTLLLDVQSTDSQDRTLDLTSGGPSPDKPAQSCTLTPGGTTTFRWDFPEQKPFESVSLTVTDRATQIACTRDFFLFNDHLNTDWKSLTHGDLTVLIAPDASGVKITKNGITAAAVYPLVGSSGNDNALIGLTESESLSAVVPDSGEVTAADDRSVTLAHRVHTSQGENLVTTQFTLDSEVLTFSQTSDIPVYGPVVHVPGVMEQAVFCGVEYLEKGENSSSTADIETPSRLRFAPPVSWVTVPLMAVVTDRSSVAFLYDDPMQRPVFASPNFVDGRFDEHRMALFGTHLSGSLRVEGPEPLEKAILWGVKRHGLPELPPNRPLDQQNELTMKAFNQSGIKAPNGWRHAFMAANNHFSPVYGSDFVSTIYEITGDYPNIPHLDLGGGHIPNYTAWFVSGQQESLLTQLNAKAAQYRAAMREDGSYKYEGKYLKGHWRDTASGFCANYLYFLLTHWQMTGNDDSLQAGLRGLAFVNQEKTPRGAQVWELSVHTPDIMGASRCTLANMLAYEATGDAQYLQAARRWAITGLPFVYLWQGPWTGDLPGVLPYATIAVFGATDWVAPNWMGRPVQWCGLDYAHALFLLAPHDDSLDWQKIAEGIVRSGQEQQYPEGPSVGLLPDSFNPEKQLRYGPDINPSALHYLRSRFMDRTQPLPTTRRSGTKQ
ncbi:MAG: hypothetical protein Q4G68_15005 [Planctomycetia bacterium]|nr:hypothetical protein [Planctomycetia bacterium]